MPRLAVDASARHAAAREAPFPDAKALRPMLATPLAAPFSRAGWIFEPKLDGVRTLAFLRDGKVELRSRRGNQMTVQYPDGKVLKDVKYKKVEEDIKNGRCIVIEQ